MADLLKRLISMTGVLATVAALSVVWALIAPAFTGYADALLQTGAYVAALVIVWFVMRWGWKEL